MPVYSCLWSHNHLDEPLFLMAWFTTSDQAWWSTLWAHSAWCWWFPVCDPRWRAVLFWAVSLWLSCWNNLSCQLSLALPRCVSRLLRCCAKGGPDATAMLLKCGECWQSKSWEGIIFTILIHYSISGKKANRSGLSLFVFAEFDISCCRWNIPLMFQRPYCLKTLLVLFFFYSSPPPH